MNSNTSVINKNSRLNSSIKAEILKIRGHFLKQNNAKNTKRKKKTKNSRQTLTNRYWNRYHFQTTEFQDESIKEDTEKIYWVNKKWNLYNSHQPWCTWPLIPKYWIQRLIERQEMDTPPYNGYINAPLPKFNRLSWPQKGRI